MAEAGAPPECTKNSDCAARGRNQVCSPLHRKCAPTTSDECAVAYGDPTPDGTVLYGLLSEIGRDDTIYFRERQHVSAAALAFTEFFDKANVTFGGRRAALIACSERFPRKATAHLANLGVKAVIGPSTEERQKAVVETLLPARIPSFSPWINGNPSAVVPATANFAWLAGFKRDDVVAPMNALLAEQETRLRATSAGQVQKVRVAVVVNTSSTTGTFNPFSEYGDLMDQRLVFNGKSAVLNERDPDCGSCYKRFGTSQADRETVAARAKEIVAFAPHFILPFADIDWGAQLLPRLEEEYAALPASVRRPIYLQAFLQIEDAGYRALAVSTADVRRRISGIRPIRDNSFEVFQNRFRDAFRPPSAPGEQGPEPNPGAGRAYETALLLLFASYAALLDDPSGRPEDVVSALRKVTDANASTRVTLNDIALGIQQLNQGRPINLDGLFTTFDFDLRTNSATPTWTTWCVSPSGQYTSGARVFANGSFGPPASCE